MTSIRQQIPGFTAGMSDQPDELLRPGTVRKLKNALPDVTLNLIKRPGLQHLGVLENAQLDGSWSNIFVENQFGLEEQYAVNITRGGVVRIWAASDAVANNGKVLHSAGDLIQVNTADPQPLGVLEEFVSRRNVPRADSVTNEYFKHVGANDLQYLNVGATTLVCNRKVVPTMSTASADNRPYEGFINLTQIAYNKVYAVNVIGPGGTNTSTTTATALSISGRTSSADGSCPGAGTQTYDITQGTKTGLRFRASIVGQPVPEAEPDGGDQFDCRYTLSVDLQNGGTGWAVGDTVTVAPGGVNYTVRVESIGTSQIANALAVIRPPATPSNADTLLQASTILTDLRDALVAAQVGGQALFTEVTIIGNGIYVRSNREFSLETPERQLMDVISTTTEAAEDPNPGTRYSVVNDASFLPDQAKDGYVIKVANTFSENDDYYVKFRGDNNEDGRGFWEECAKPGVKTTFNSGTMPQILRRVYDSATETVSFEVSPVDWAQRTAGDDITNPIPSFVQDTADSFPTINNMLLFRNRLVFLSGSNVILSQVGDLSNWFADTALTITAADPIDLDCSSDASAVLYSGVVVNNGMVLFSRFSQFIFTTDADTLSPTTAKVSLLSRYDFNINTDAFMMASNVGWFSSAGNDSVFWEMTDIYREGPPTVNERSKPVSRTLPSELEEIVVSKEDGIIMAGKRGSNEIFNYRYYTENNRQIQTAWYMWTLPGDLLFHFNNTRGKYWAIYNDGNTATLVNMDLKDKLRAESVEGLPFEYYVYLDNWFEADTTFANKRTTFTPPFTPTKDLYAYSLDTDEFRGRSTKVKVDNGTYYLDGDWTDAAVAIGYQFEMSVEFPRLYRFLTSGDIVRADTSGRLTLHRVHLNMGISGIFDVDIHRYGKDDYNLTYEATIQDGYDADRVAGYTDQIYTIPIYDTSDTCRMNLKSSYPVPCTLISMTYEGDYSTKFYKRV